MTTNGTLEILKGSASDSAQPGKVVHVSTGDVDLALAKVADDYPELARCMAVTRAMITRLDTIRHEAKFGALVVKGKVEAGASAEAAADLQRLVRWLDTWSKRHELML